MNIENVTSDDMTLSYYGLLTQKNIYEQEIERLNNIINKAKEYIEHAQNYGTMAQVMPHLKLYVNGDDVLDILKGSDKE